MSQQQIEVKNLFLNYFNNQGYQFTPELELVSEDKSLIFTNSTIVPWKPYLLNNSVPDHGFHMKQRCLRLQGLRDHIRPGIENERTFDEYLGLFNMLGIIVNSNQRINVQKQILELLLETYSIPASEITIFSRSDSNFISEFQKEVKVEVDSKKTSFYNWEYGMKGITGNGATFSLSQDEPNISGDIGQIIEIRNNGEVVGYEFAIGLETFLSKKHKNNSYSPWSINSTVPEQLQFRILLDMYSSLGAMLTIKDNLIGNSQKREIKRVAKRVIDLEKIFSISSEQSKNSISKFVDIEFNGLQLEEKIEESLSNARKDAIKNEEKFRKFLEKLKRKQISSEEIKIQAELNRYGTYGILPKIAEEIYNELNII